MFQPPGQYAGWAAPQQQPQLPLQPSLHPPGSFNQPPLSAPYLGQQQATQQLPPHPQQPIHHHPHRPHGHYEGGDHPHRQRDYFQHDLRVYEDFATGARERDSHRHDDGDRDRDRDRHRESSRDREYRDRSTYRDLDREPVEVYERDRGHSSERDRDRDRDRDYWHDREHDRDHNRDRDRDREHPAPSSVIMIRGLQPITTTESLTHAIHMWANPEDIITVRLLRDRRTGVSRGFAFAEFVSLAAADRFLQAHLERRQAYLQQGAPAETTGITVFPIDGYFGDLEYSRPPPGTDKRTGLDWICPYCRTMNFARRVACFQCEAPKPAVVETVTDANRPQQQQAFPLQAAARFGGPGRATTPHSAAETTVEATGLDPLTNEETIRGVFSSFGPVKQLRIVYEQGTGVSQGKAYIEYYGVDVASEAVEVARAGQLQIEGREIRLAFHRPPASQQPSSVASTPSSTPAGYVYDAKSGYYQDTSTGYFYDPKTGYYYDPATQRYLYYDTRTQSYMAYNAPNSASTNIASTSVQKPDDSVTPTTTAPSTSTTAAAALASESTGTAATTVPPSEPEEEKIVAVASSFLDSLASVTGISTAPPSDTAAPTATASTTTSTTTATTRSIPIEKKAKKPTKLIGAKKLTLEMQKWSQKSKELAEATAAEEAEKKALAEQAAATKAPIKFQLSGVNAIQVPKKAAAIAAAADLAAAAESAASATELETRSEVVSISTTTAASSNAAPAVAPGGGASVCLLCKRQFKSAEALAKHELLSELHQQNLEIQRVMLEKQAKEAELEKLRTAPIAGSKKRKHGDMDPTPASVNEPLADDSKGSKMMKLMGWKQGEGLGKASSGMNAPIAVHLRSERAGLGTDKGTTPDMAIQPGDDRRMIASKKARQRYHALDDEE